MLARKDFCRFNCGRISFTLGPLDGQLNRSGLEKFLVALLLSNIPSPTGVELDIGGDVRLTEVKSVSACENAFDRVWSRTDVSPLRRLYPEIRRGLVSAAVDTVCDVLLVGRCIGNGGTGKLGG